jgi:hypothetical protein
MTYIIAEGLEQLLPSPRSLCLSTPRILLQLILRNTYCFLLRLTFLVFAVLLRTVVDAFPRAYLF